MYKKEPVASEFPVANQGIDEISTFKELVGQ